LVEVRVTPLGRAAPRRLTRWAPPAAFAALLALLVSACAATPAERDRDTLRVVTSMSVIADFARQVGGEHVEVVSLVPTGADPHTHEPTPADARAVADADLVLANGAGLEPWFDALADADREVVRLTEDLRGRVRADGDGEPDPHLWMVPELATAYVDALAEALAEADPRRAAEYRANAAAFAGELRELDEELAAALAAIPPARRVLVTPHDAYAYFADAYDLEVATVVGVSTEEEPSAAAVQRVIDEVRARQVPTVFVEATVNRAVIDRVAADAGVEVGRPLYGDSVGEPGSGAETYVDMMRANVDALVDGLAAP
jgi:ABC-type Zn uptake system ZnuABC Zn-binding protein ZnuA